MTMLVEHTNYKTQINFQAYTPKQMVLWKRLNKIPLYTNASYNGYTGMTYKIFPITNGLDHKNYPDITEALHILEKEIIQELEESRKKPFGLFRAMWKMCKNFGTGSPWDSKFLPEFPGRNHQGKKQYAMYRGEIVSGNDVSNRLFGHICQYLGLPTKFAQLMAKLDAAGILEPFSKGKLPTFDLLKFRDTSSDQLAILKGMEEFDINVIKKLDSSSTHFNA